MSHLQWGLENEQERGTPQTGRILSQGWKAPFYMWSKTSHTPLVKVRYHLSQCHLCVAPQMTVSKDVAWLKPARTQAEEKRQAILLISSFKKHGTPSYPTSFLWTIRYTVLYKCLWFEPSINRSPWQHSKGTTCMWGRLKQKYMPSTAVSGLADNDTRPGHSTAHNQTRSWRGAVSKSYHGRRSRGLATVFTH